MRKRSNDAMQDNKAIGKQNKLLNEMQEAFKTFDNLQKSHKEKSKPTPDQIPDQIPAHIPQQIETSDTREKETLLHKISRWHFPGISIFGKKTHSSNTKEQKPSPKEKAKPAASMPHMVLLNKDSPRNKNKRSASHYDVFSFNQNNNFIAGIAGPAKDAQEVWQKLPETTRGAWNAVSMDESGSTMMVDLKSKDFDVKQCKIEDLAQRFKNLTLCYFTRDYNAVPFPNSNIYDMSDTVNYYDTLIGHIDQQMISNMNLEHTWLEKSGDKTSMKLKDAILKQLNTIELKDVVTEKEKHDKRPFFYGLCKKFMERLQIFADINQQDSNLNKKVTRSASMCVY